MRRSGAPRGNDGSRFYGYFRVMKHARHSSVAANRSCRSTAAAVGLRCHLTRTFILAPHVLAGILSLALSVTGAIVQAQNYPTKPIRFVTSEAGGGTDFAARTVAQGIAG